MATTLDFLVSAHFPDAKIDEQNLENDIRRGADGNPPLVTNLIDVAVSNDVVSIVFAGVIPITDHTRLYGATQFPVSKVQVDATLNPGPTPIAGDRYMLADVANLHANFGTISGVENGDIVQYNGSAFVIDLDVSVAGDGQTIYDMGNHTYYQYDGGWNADNGALDGFIGNHDNVLKSTPEVAQITVADEARPVAVAADFPPVVEQKHYVTYNFAKKETWYQKAIRFDDQACTVTGDPLIYAPGSAITETIINANQGLIHLEDQDPAVLIHKFIVKVDGERKRIKSYHGTSHPDTSDWDNYGYDCEVDFSNGNVKFKDDPAPGTVTISYSTLDPNLDPRGGRFNAMQQSMFCMELYPGSRLRILKAETQFTANVKLMDDLIFSAITPLSFDAIQSNISFDPGAAPKIGTRVLVQDVANLHPNFTLLGPVVCNHFDWLDEVGNGDVIEFNNRLGWGVIFDASEHDHATLGNAHGVYTQGNGGAGEFYRWDGATWTGLGFGMAPLHRVEVFGERKIYKRFGDYLNEATGNSAGIAADFVQSQFGGFANAILQIPWNWIGTKLLKKSQNVTIAMWLRNGVPMEGELVTGTLYCQVYDEE